MDILSNFSDYITEQLFKENTNMFEFSKRIGIDDFVISRWVKEKYLPSLKNLIQIADFFNTSIDYTLGLSEDNYFIKNEADDTFIDRLKLLISKKNITPYKVAKDCGFGRAAVSKWLLNQSVPKIDNLVKLSNYFNCSLDYLIARSIK